MISDKEIKKYEFDDSCECTEVHEDIATYQSSSNERLMVQGMETFMKLRHSNQLPYVVAMMNIALRQTGANETYRNRLRLTRCMEGIVADKDLQENYESFSANVIDNVRKFLSLVFSDDMLTHATISPRINGTFLINWRTDNIFGSVNIGNSSYSYSLLNKSNMKSVSEQHDINDVASIESFYNHFIAEDITEAQ